jgi:hypothetical protein
MKIIKIKSIWACPFALLRVGLLRASLFASAILFASLKGSAASLPSHPSRYSEFLILTSDTSKKDTSSKEKIHKPSKAALYSTILPGLGQAYNKKFWKIPIVYGVIGTIAFFAYNNHKEYLIFRDALRARYDDNPDTNDNFPNINDQVLKAQREYYRRNRDLFMIIGVIAYGLNILDAYVDAHLKGFTVSDKLSIKPIPSFHGIQVGLTWNFK